MKKTISFLFALLLTLPMLSIAKNDKEEETVSIGKEYHKNNIKVNLLALSMTNFSFQYERALSRKFSVAMGASIRPLGNLPFNGFIHKQLKNQTTDTAAFNFIDRAKISSWAFTPEVRYYLGHKPLNGFYLAPFARVSGQTLDWNYLFLDQSNLQHDINFKGYATTLTFGLMFGCQWHLSNRLLIDWWMLGPSYGSVVLNLNANTDMTVLSAQDRATLQDKVNSVFNDVGKTYNIGSSTEVKDNGVFFSASAPFASIRTGFCIGLSF
jgi:hypothetical protein